MIDTPSPTPLRPSQFWWHVLAGVSLSLVIGVSMLWLYITSLNQPPATFPVNTPIVITPGMSVKSITELMAEANVVHSATWLYLLLSWSHDPTMIKASTYQFSTPLTTKQVAERLIAGDYESTLVRITHIEGERASTLARRLADTLPEFSPEAFIAAAEPFEGTLYPDTYLVPPDYTAADMLALLRQTYEDTVAPLRPRIAEQSLTEQEIITLASIIEREANSLESKRIVAGILLRRLAIGMPLQADASIEYVLDKPLSELTPADLDRDTPYNTYLYRGLPPTPIGNPGLEAIMAVLEPTQTPYLFYITGNDGEFYYAETYAEHQRNIARHLR